MAAKTPILIFGATGYIGGTVLAKLLAHPTANAFDITALVRSEEKAKKLEAFGVRTAIGSYKDHALVEELVENAHIVFNIADADDLPAIQAVFKGLKARHDKLGDVPVLIHTSGTAVVIEGEDKGNVASEHIFDDSNVEQIAGINPAAPHRNVDEAVFAADSEGYCRTYIVSPGTIYGLARGPLVDAGVQNRFSIQIPYLIKASLARGRAGVVGRGVALWPDVHVDDVADLYVVLLDAIAARGADAVDHGARGYYFAENGEHSWGELSRAVGRAMVELGLATDAEPTPFSDEELARYFGSVEMGNLWGSNARVRATHSKALGWKPKYTVQDMLASIKPEVEAIAKQQAAQKQ